MSNGVVRFGVFELDRDAGELRRAGRRVRLTPQSVQLLALLTARAGEVVTRDEIRLALWGDAFIEFESAINACVSQIRSALQDKATAPRFVETLPRRGYRFIARIEPQPSAPNEAAPEPPPAISGHRVLLRTAPALLLLVVVAVVVAWRIDVARAAHAGPLRFAVLPFDAPADDGELLSLGNLLQDRTIFELYRRLGGAGVVLARPAVEGFRGEARTIERLREIAPDYCIDAHLQRVEGKVRLHAKVVRAGDLRILWMDNYELPAKTFVTYRAQFASELAQRLLKAPRHPMSVVRPHDEAAEAALSGSDDLEVIGPENLGEAIKHLERAVSLDPSNLVARGLLARALARAAAKSMFGITFEQAREQAQAVLQKDPGNVDALTALGAVAMYADRNWPQAGRLLQRAAESEDAPRDALVYYSWWLSIHHRHDRAVAVVSSLEAREPVSNAASFVAEVCYFAGRYPEAMAAADRELALHPDSDLALFISYLSRNAAGRLPEAVEALDHLTRIGGWEGPPLPPGAPELRFRIALERERLELERLDRAGMHFPVAAAIVSLQLGEPEAAMDRLRTLNGRVDPSAIFLTAFPDLAPLRSRAEFRELASRFTPRLDPAPGTDSRYSK